MLTICPYLLKPIADLREDAVSDEHIIPHAIGGSNRFVLPVDKRLNSMFGETVDSDLIHDPQLRFMAASYGVQSRTGKVSVQLSGVLVETGEEVTVEFGEGGIGERRIKHSHIKDSGTGKLKGIRGFDSQFERELEKLKKGRSKRVEFSDQQRIENPLVKLEIPSDPLKVSRGLAKIAYLMTCRTLGNAFALSSYGNAYRAAIRAKDWDEFDACGLTLLWGADFPMTVVLPDTDAHLHLVACFAAGRMAFTTVRLFGGLAVSTFGFPAQGTAMRDLQGDVVVIDCRDRTYTERSLMEAVPLDVMIRRMVDHQQRRAQTNA